MSDRVGVAQLRQNLSKYLRRVEKGERLIVTDRNRPVASLGPLPEHADPWDQLIAEGVVVPAAHPLPDDWEPIELGGSPEDTQRALDETRADRL